MWGAIPFLIMFLTLCVICVGAMAECYHKGQWLGVVGAGGFLLVCFYFTIDVVAYMWRNRRG